MNNILHTPFLLYFRLKNVSHLHQSVSINVCKLSSVIHILQVKHGRHVNVIERRSFKIRFFVVAYEFKKLRHDDVRIRQKTAGKYVKRLK